MSDLRVYSFGLPFGPDETSAAVVDRQLWLGRLYQNDLIAIERARIAAVRAIQSEVANVADLEEQLAAVREEILDHTAKIKRANAARRRRSVDPADKAHQKALKARRKELTAALRAAKAALRDDPEVQAKLKACNQRAHDMKLRHRGAYSARGLYWGTYNRVEDAVKSASKPPSKGRRGGWDGPRHRRWDQSGCMEVQIQKGLPVAGAWGGNAQLQIDRPPAEAWMDSTPRGERKRLQRTVVRIRACSVSDLLAMGIDHPAADGRKTGPVWAEARMVMHRPLPPDGIIKRAWLQRRRVGTGFRWQLQIVVAAESHRRKAPNGGAVAIDFGAKGKAGGRLVAKAVGTDGRVVDLRLPGNGGIKYGVAESLAHADHLRSVRDVRLDCAREDLLDWLARHDAPTWLRDDTRHLRKWRSPSRMLHLLGTWDRRRFDGDAEIVAVLDTWRRKERHLHEWEANERRKAVLRRREVFRVWAADLARSYGTLVTEDIDFAKLARRPDTASNEKREGELSTVNRNARAASPGIAREIVRSAFAGHEVRLPTSGRAGRCAACGEPAVEGDHVTACTSCGAQMDADFARCWHLLRDAGFDAGEVKKTNEAADSLVRSMQEGVRR